MIKYLLYVHSLFFHFFLPIFDHGIMKSNINNYLSKKAISHDKCV